MAVSSRALEIQDQKFHDLGFQKYTAYPSGICCYSRFNGEGPILVLIHGYPQSAYMWRHVISHLPQNMPIFVADLPGYGASPPLETHDKLSIGTALLNAVKQDYRRRFSRKSSTGEGDFDVVLVGHDRGARVAHRLAVSGVEGFRIEGVCLIDIVPTTTQWAASSNPAEITGYFHWPFLANVDLATRMITAFGPAKWCEEMILRWAGSNPTALTLLKSDNAVEVYTSFFSQPHTIEASNRDYEAGATVDVTAQNEDQDVGRKIEVPLLLVWSEAGIGKRYDMEGVWGDWVGEEVQVTTKALGRGVGHFGAEEAPEETAEALLGWLKSV